MGRQWQSVGVPVGTSFHEQLQVKPATIGLSGRRPRRETLGHLPLFCAAAAAAANWGMGPCCPCIDPTRQAPTTSSFTCTCHTQLILPHRPATNSLPSCMHIQRTAQHRALPQTTPRPAITHLLHTFHTRAEPQRKTPITEPAAHRTAPHSNSHRAYSWMHQTRPPSRHTATAHTTCALRHKRCLSSEMCAATSFAAPLGLSAQLPSHHHARTSSGTIHCLKWARLAHPTHETPSQGTDLMSSFTSS